MHVARSAFAAFAAFALIVFASAGCVKEGTTATTAPDFTAKDTLGSTFRLSDHLGKEVILLDFWSTWCEPCKAEFPHLRALYEEKKAKGFLVVGVAMDGPETIADVPGFVRTHNLTFPVVTDEDSRIASLYNPSKHQPLSVVIDRAGRISNVHDGYNVGEEVEIRREVEKVLP